MPVRTRFAPSPTGFIHIGNLRSAIFTYLIAKQDQGTFVLRIEDTDQERYVDGAVDAIYATLNACGLHWDEGPDKDGAYGPYIQSERMASYADHAHQLVDEGKAYKCFCTPERLQFLKDQGHTTYDRHCRNLSTAAIKAKEAAGAPYVIRQKVPLDGATSFTCQVYGDITIENKEIEDQVLLKSDGYPTYNFANVVDDHLMAITHVVRGNEYLTSTPKYTLLYQAFGWDEPKYVHLPHVVKEGGKKLSKRDGDAYFSDFLQKGYLPEAIVNFLALLGWSPDTNDELFTLEELVEVFSIDRIHTSPAVFDIEKLNWMNAQYLKRLDENDLIERARRFLQDAGRLDGHDDQWVAEFVRLFAERLDYLGQIVDLYDEHIARPFELDEEMTAFLAQEGVHETLSAFLDLLEDLTAFNASGIQPLIKESGKQSGAKGKMLFMPLRIATTASMHGPDLPRLLALLGRDTVLTRLRSILKR
jgi:glutamyl-tRNA synthetase